jgi:hypothetical protein
MINSKSEMQNSKFEIKKKHKKRARFKLMGALSLSPLSLPSFSSLEPITVGGLVPHVFVAQGG